MIFCHTNTNKILTQHIQINYSLAFTCFVLPWKQQLCHTNTCQKIREMRLTKNLLFKHPDTIFAFNRDLLTGQTSSFCTLCHVSSAFSIYAIGVSTILLRQVFWKKIYISKKNKFCSMLCVVSMKNQNTISSWLSLVSFLDHAHWRDSVNFLSRTNNYCNQFACL